MIARASRRLESGDVLGAREILLAAEEGSQGPVLFALAETYDPNMLAAWGTRGVAADVARARALYRKALSLGVASAHGRHEALARAAAGTGLAVPDSAPAEQPPGFSSRRFRWPVRGSVIASFGKRPDGTHNDGINIAVPLGTEIHAAESGWVAYAGDELEGYGNLVLIRHTNGWVSAYAHAHQILVKSDDVVRQGQVIAKAGKTGTVDQPQLHFELRQGAKLQIAARESLGEPWVCR